MTGVCTEDALVTGWAADYGDTVPARRVSQCAGQVYTPAVTYGKAGSMTSDDILVENLLRRGIPFLSGGDLSALDLDDGALLGGLASSGDARVRSAVIALLLARPAAGAAVEQAMARVDPRAKDTLVFFYTAATWLQRLHDTTLRGLCPTWFVLPHLFEEALGIDADTPIAALRQLAARQSSTDPAGVNWLGTYQHAAEHVIRRLSQELVWQRA